MGSQPPTPAPEDGENKARVHIRADIPEGMRLRVTIEAAAAQDDFRIDSQVILDSSGSYVSTVHPIRPKNLHKQTGWSRFSAACAQVWNTCARFLAPFLAVFAGLWKKLGLEGSLLLAALLVYLVTRFVALPDFPIYFFTDEAVQTVLAGDLVRDRFYSPDDEFLPTYFYNSYQYNLSFSVYLQVIPYLLFGKSIWVTRGVSVLVTALGAACAGLTMRKVFNLPAAFSAILFLSITPAWFLHSRTAFETALATSFFACFIFCYLMYRSASPRWLFGAVVAGALTFYSYSPARMVIGVAALLLFLVDIPYHWRQRKTVGLAFLLTLLLCLPMVRFMINHPEANTQHLRQLSSYWIQSIPLAEKLGHYFLEYLRGLDPRYWYLPNEADLPRHLMKGYGHVFWATFPFALTGLVVSIFRIRQPAYRTLLVALLAAPSGAALVALGITRSLCMVVPLALLSSVGLAFLLEKACKRWDLRKWNTALLLLIFLLAAGWNVWMLVDSLTNGPLWYQDYGLAGMQYGARQAFQAVKDILAEDPNQRIVFSPSWANGTDTIARFFFPDPKPFEIGSIEGYFDEHRPLDKHTLFIMIPEEYRRVAESVKFTDIHVRDTIPYPNGEPGFYLVNLRYVDTIDEILAIEQAQRRILQERQVTVMGGAALVRYSYLDMGDIGQAFDGSMDSVIRTMEANPLVVEMEFDSPRTFSHLSVQVGGTPTEVTIEVTPPDSSETRSFSKEVEGNPTPRAVEFDFDETMQVAALRIEIRSVYDSEPAHVHLWEISFE